MSSAVSTKCTVFNLAVTGSTIRCVMTWLTFLGYLAFFNLDSKILSLSLEFLSLSHTDSSPVSLDADRSSICHAGIRTTFCGKFNQFPRLQRPRPSVLILPNATFKHLLQAVGVHEHASSIIMS